MKRLMVALMLMLLPLSAHAQTISRESILEQIIALQQQVLHLIELQQQVSFQGAATSSTLMNATTTESLLPATTTAPTPTHAACRESYSVHGLERVCGDI